MRASCGHERRAVRAHGAAARHVFVVDVAGFLLEHALDLVDRRAGLHHTARRCRFIRSMAQNRLTAVGRVAAITSHSRWNSVANCLVPLRRAALHAQRQAHGGGDADGRRAADHHGLDGPGDLFRGLAGDVQLRRRQLALVDHHDGVVFPLDGRQHADGFQCSRRARRYFKSRASNGSGSSALSRWRPFLGAQVREDHFEVAAELPQDLPARPARRRRVGRVGHHGDAAEAAVPVRERLEHRDALGAHGQPVGGVLDVAAGDDRCRRRLRARRRP